jgi:hypothetical protein
MTHVCAREVIGAGSPPPASLLHTLRHPQVYGTLLGALESPMMELFAMEGSAEELLACLEDTGGPDVAGLLDYKAAVDGSQQGADGGGAAAAPRPA